ncbi:hypothetical protein DA2_3277 [Desulfovibrio sp. A2]|nr:hypothetical protein DA2_3277 [Desulfovibrio sp. A2]
MVAPLRGPAATSCRPAGTAHAHGARAGQARPPMRGRGPPPSAGDIPGVATECPRMDFPACPL